MPLIINTLVGWFGIFAPILTLVPTTPSTLTIGRLRVGRLETRVNTGLEDRQSGNPRRQWAGGQPLRRSPFYAGFRAGVAAGAVAGLRLRLQRD